MMKCPICDKIFNLSDDIAEHLEVHKTESILNSTSEVIKIPDTKSTNVISKTDRAKLFGKDKFEKSASKKLESIQGIEKLVQYRQFIEQVKKLTSKHPFVYVPYFIQDLFDGKGSTDIIKKYNLPNYLSFQTLTQNILKLDGRRYLSQKYADAFELNLKNITWKEKFDKFNENCIYFQNELLELILHNILRAYIILEISDHRDTGISREDIIINIRSLYKYNIFRFVDDKLKQLFSKYFDASFDNTVNNMIHELLVKKILQRNRYTPSLLTVKVSIDEIKKEIEKELIHNSDNQNEITIKNNVLENYPSLQLIPGLDMWNTALKELQDEQVIHIESTSKSLKNTFIFLNKDYQKMKYQLQHFGNSFTKFYGRKITPVNFIRELLELEKGDFDDQDDQVTRVAGLILAESVKLQSPHESIPEFDFSTDISNYSFRDEQLEAIKKLNFKIMSNILHCKVMLSDALTLEEYHNLKNALPPNEQGIVITFNKIPIDVQELLNADSSIQIIDEYGLKIWVSISSTIPSRKNSIAKLYDDPISKLSNKLVQINLLNYESGLASVSIIPEMNEVTVLIRSLEEIPLNESNPNDFELLSKHYIEFLRIVAALSTYEDFIEGLFTTKINDYKSVSSNILIFNFDNHKVSLNSNNSEKKKIIYCDCLKWAENSLQLCPHGIASLDHTFKMYAESNSNWNNESPIKKVLENITCNNISTILYRLRIECTDSGISGNTDIVHFVSGISKIKLNS